LRGKYCTIKVRDQTIRFWPGTPQRGLKAVAIAGDDRKINPVSDDFYSSLIDRRSELKTKLKAAIDAGEKGELDTAQNALKIVANATSYGIFVELNVGDLDGAETRLCHGPGDAPFPISTAKEEAPGKYFHPLLATLITGAARLMLAIVERLAIDAGLDWAFCDTDSMALAKPDAMGHAEFVKRALGVCEWFTPLNPYAAKGPIFKVEDANFKPGTKEVQPLYVWAVSAKRYAFFNLGTDGKPQTRKASAHGLGHLMKPYGDDEAPTNIPAPPVQLSEIGVDRWQYDLWFQIIRAARDGHPDQVDLSYHTALKQVAMSRYAATTPAQLGWFKRHSLTRSYRDQVKPFNFLVAAQSNPFASGRRKAEERHVDPKIRRSRARKSPLKPIAPYFKRSEEAAAHWFDRDTQQPIAPIALKTYRQALAQYHLSPESKFENGDYLDCGSTSRRYVDASAILHSGKEADRLEEQYFLGLDEDADIE
jgi:DNA polymerase family B